MTPGRRLTVALVGLIALVVVGYFAKDHGNDSTPAPPSSSAGTTSVPGASASGFSVQPLSELPAQAAETWKLITSDGPFPYPRNDGVVFRNREKLLPQHKGEYYREYTVPTPGSRDRGARRLVTGQEDEVYYTADHYESFVVVDVAR
ncbi:ribonuclease N [Actinosynnema pretiosum subsp. pretiosum]|uniref:Guanine-specific ribonuclease N1 and T1 n=2 Tax=Actinosynnema TaxID=40566 RepID=C6WRC7_ACTMD|nr:ribonuclease domain-containing protein [Actinosynnema mirum]ACU35179.1 guanine-specific ribonuclease N1 and T1 [Actinosynnema mirum DSM 43827]AXX28559.1 Guanyl-specific ribonuclease St [Actinosynnema pretiosum subsp. pretiosum]QUF07105.1 ribonuclease N [Actinosynnema pretiosum subsp. pretiosum]